MTSNCWCGAKMTLKSQIRANEISLFVRKDSNCSLGKCKCKNALFKKQIILQMVSISPTFYTLLFRRKVSSKAFLYLDIRFVLFWRKNIDAKAARNMLVKLTLERLKKFQKGLNEVLILCERKVLHCL
jgi:hypothetical protein